MEGQELIEGKKRVRQSLIDPLVNRGMVRKRGVSVDQHAAMLASLEARLAYMAADRLEALAEVVECWAEGPKKNVWPSEISITNWARQLQDPPASVSRLVRTYLQSGAGDAAVSQGYVVELFLHLKRFGAPPNDYALKGIIQDAGTNASRAVLIEKQIKERRASPTDQAWLKGYMDCRRRCLDIHKAKPGRAAA